MSVPKPDKFYSKCLDFNFRPNKEAFQTPSLQSSTSQVKLQTEKLVTRQRPGAQTKGDFSKFISSEFAKVKFH